jgi:multicomponent Na+:H+ antiporter subunit E
MITIRSAIIRFLLFSGFWIVITSGNMTDLWLAAIITAAGTWSSLVLLPPKQMKLKPERLLIFLPWFVLQSVLGGVDVALRALKPDMPLNPGFEKYPVRLKSEAAKVLFMWVISLLPGTASAADNKEHLMVHFLNHNPRNIAKLSDLEKRIGWLFGEVIG